MDISLVKSPQSFHESEVYTVWVKNIQSNVYDRSDKAYPYTPNSPLYLEISSPDTTLKEVYFNEELYATNTAKIFQITITPLLNKTNRIYAKDTAGRRTNEIIFNVYNTHFLAFVLTSKFQDLFDEIRQSDADRLLTTDNSAGVFNNTLKPTDKALFRMFGDPLLVRRVNDNYAAYVEKLSKVQDGFYHCATVKGFRQVLEAFSSGTFDFITYDALEEFKSSAARSVKRKSSLTVEWLPGWLKMNGQSFFLDAGETTVSSGSEIYVYVDGEVSGITNYLVVKTTTIEPIGLDENITEEIDTIHTDSDGSITGFKGGRYVITNHPIISLVASSSTGTTNTVGASRIEGYSSVVNLHTTEDDAIIGKVTLQYNAHVRPIILAKVTTEDEITKIEDPIPSRGALYRTRAKEESDFELYMDQVSFTSEEEQQLLELLTELNTASGTGHVYVKDAISFPYVFGDFTFEDPDYEYHKTNYRYLGVI